MDSNFIPLEQKVRKSLYVSRCINLIVLIYKMIFEVVWSELCYVIYSFTVQLSDSWGKQVKPYIIIFDTVIYR